MILYSDIIKVNNTDGTASEAVYANKAHIEKYVNEVIAKGEERKDRKYCFDPAKSATKELISEFLNTEHHQTVALKLGELLAKAEQKKNQVIKKMGNTIPIGILIVAYVTIDGNDRVILLKVDSDSFIEDGTGEINIGLSEKNIIFKTCTINVIKSDAGCEFHEILASDSTKRQAEYWVGDFLELQVIHSDKDNTLTAFRTINKKVLAPIRTLYKSDYALLHQKTVAYFRQEGEFDLDYFKDELIGKHVPIDAGLKVEDLKKSIESVSKAGSFDKVFTKDVASTDNNVFDVWKLNGNLELKIIHNLPGIHNDIVPFEYDGKKAIIIVSEEGYNLAKGLKEKGANNE